MDIKTASPSSESRYIVISMFLPPTREIQLTIKEQLWQDPEKTEIQIAHFKEWISKQPHLPQEHDDVWLERFLNGCKYDLEKCKNVFENYYTVRSAVPEFFSNRDPTSSDIQDTFKVTFSIGLPAHTPDGYRVAMIGLLNKDPSKMNFEAHLKRSFLISDATLLMEPCFGNVFILDMKDMSLPHGRQFDPVMMKKFIFCIQNALPMRIKQVHIINAPSVLKMIQAISYPFLKQKLKDRVHVHSKNLETLYKYVPQDMLPEEYGGKAGKIKDLNDAWIMKIESLRDWYSSEEKKKIDESQRVGKCVDYSHMFGLEGTFRYLTLD